VLAWGTSMDSCTILHDESSGVKGTRRGSSFSWTGRMRPTSSSAVLWPQEGNSALPRGSDRRQDEYFLVRGLPRRPVPFSIGVIAAQVAGRMGTDDAVPAGVQKQICGQGVGTQTPRCGRPGRRLPSWSPAPRGVRKSASSATADRRRSRIALTLPIPARVSS